jgi:phosphoribosyl 1,2-cyclic phosphate phosphodiesterase
MLGTGTSMGVPQIGCACPVCRSSDPRDQRTRTSAVIQHGKHALLIDTPPELRLQLIRAAVPHVDAVLYTHHHADHVNGIDDLRSFSQVRESELPVYGPPETLRHLRSAFGYIFDGIPAVVGTSKPALSLHPLVAGQAASIAGFDVLPLAFEHGTMPVFGYRIGPIGYLTDVKRVDEAACAQLLGVQVLVVNALWWRPHPTHLSIDEAVDVARRVGAERTFLTHLTHETSHAEFLRRLPAGVEPGYDGLTVEIRDEVNSE